jgi:hypothetical protein
MGFSDFQSSHQHQQQMRATYGDGGSSVGVRQQKLYVAPLTKAFGR